jgi:MoaA/NifB/PqqE/SkfB family radical SAM enzyme
VGSSHLTASTMNPRPGPGSSLVQLRPSPGEIPEVPLTALDQLWFQVSGTVCNLRCRHCFISCAPDNHSFWFMERAQVRRALEASVDLGVKEYYFTGGEPFMHREMVGMLEDALALGPATVLTNATLLAERPVEALARAAATSVYSLEIRVSLDGVTAEMNDAIRGEGAFERAMRGVERLVGAGFLPIITAMQSWPDRETEEILGRFRELLAGIGYTRARLKILPPLQIGAEAERTQGYHPEERVTHEMLHGYDLDQLLCTRARLVTARGVYACPILLESPSARLGDTLSQAIKAPAPLGEQACYTCYRSGAICSNVPSGGRGLQ